MTSSIKQEYIDYRLHSAKETLKAAKLLAENSHWNSDINRLYYSCFYSISHYFINMILMLILMQGLSISSHFISLKTV
ncbi:MAG: HEPN domain-containing protein [Bacteroidetes bacterium]|nr:MAG: HEPN domain-containing protein [Bacteroidota bacterium]